MKFLKFIKQQVFKFFYFFKKFFIKHRVYIKNETPCILTLKNTSKKEQQAVLFGSNVYSHLSNQNFGMNKNVSVTLNDGISDPSESVKYQQFLLKSANHPFRIDLMRLMYDKFDLTKPIRIIVRDANAKEYARPLYPVNHFSIYQFQDNIVDINDVNIPIDAQTELLFSLKPESCLSVVLWTSIRKRVSFYQYLKLKKNDTRYDFEPKMPTFTLTPNRSIIYYFKRIILSLINKPLNK